jgi:uncharacterized membrane protein YjgN (DUF898 family)
MSDQTDSALPKTAISERLTYNGSGNELAILMFKNLALTILTLGIYSAWGRTNTRRYLWGQISFMGDRGAYTGTGKELFKGWMIVIGSYIAIYAGIFILKFIHPLLVIVSFPLFIYLFALAIYGGSRYRLSRTSWRGIRFGMEKDKASTKEFVILAFKNVALIMVTLGFYAPYFQNNIRRFLINKARFGTAKFNFEGNNKDFFILFFTNVLLTMITLGFYGSWMAINLLKYKLENSKLEGSLKFKTHLSGKDLFIFSFIAYLATICTLGLALPWVINRSMKLFVNSIEVHGEIDFAHIQNIEASGNALGDVAVVEYDLDLGL